MAVSLRKNLRLYRLFVIRELSSTGDAARLLGTQVLDCGIDVGASDMEAHTVKLGELFFQYGYNPG